MASTILMTQSQLGERWHLSPRTLERWRWEGIGPVHLKIGGRVLYRLEDIEAYERGQMRTETTKDEGTLLGEEMRL
ncbi:MAG: helix-turn-helix domain-containing protein [Alphaproteobacteria bacterium]|nr:MAG: helix-turn-helix domain-containing protein [Alphaproteobacteria bacterium]